MKKKHSPFIFVLLFIIFSSEIFVLFLNSKFYNKS